MFQMDPFEPFQMDPSERSPSSSSQPRTATMMTSSGKSQRQPRKPPVKPDSTWVVERIDSVIGIPEPEQTRRKWRTVCRVIARTRVAITHPDWCDVTQVERESLYAELKQSFRVPDEAEEEF